MSLKITEINISSSSLDLQFPSLEIDALGSCMLPFSNQTFSIILMTLFIQDLADNNRMPTAFAL